MIVELLDHRPPRACDPPIDKPVPNRVILRPDSETLWADICSMNQRLEKTWSDTDALDIEAKILVCIMTKRTLVLSHSIHLSKLATAPPLCLDPNPHLARIANATLRVTTPRVPQSLSLKRKSSALESSEVNESERARYAKIMQFMNPRAGRSHVPT